MTNDGSSYLVFACSGRKVYANNGIVGIGPTLAISEGYDGSMNEAEELNACERAELADYMIDLWSRWKVAEPKPEDWD